MAMEQMEDLTHHTIFTCKFSNLPIFRLADSKPIESAIGCGAIAYTAATSLVCFVLADAVNPHR